MRYGVLRVLNDDVVTPGAGFGEHGHSDMEIISIVLDGALEHRDSAGHHETLRRGDVQVMSAGSGIRHSEKNGSQSEPVHFIQIWIEPDRAGCLPRHASLPAGDRASNQWIEIASGDPRSSGLRINQNATLSIVELDKDSSIGAAVPGNRLGYVHIATGSVDFGGSRLVAGDAIELDAGAAVLLRASEDTMLVRFDLPPA